MKKVLYGTTAIVAAGMFATTASAADPIKLTAGGSMQQWLGYVSTESDLNAAGVAATYNTVGISTDTQLTFGGETKLDNGWTVSAAIELDTQNNGAAGVASIAQEFLTVATPFGTVQAGFADELSASTGIDAPDVGIGYGDARRWAPNPQNWTSPGNFGSTQLVDAMANGTTAMAGYMTPNFGGFQANVSVMPGLLTTNATNTGGNDALQESWTAGAAYNADLGGVALGVAAAYGYEGGATTTQAADLWNAGLSVGFGPVKVAGAYLDKNLADTGTTKGDVTVWNLGVQFDIDAWNLSAGYHNETIDTTTGNQDEFEQATYMASARYNLGGGVQWRTSAFVVDHNGGSSSDNNNNSSTGIVTGLNLSF